MPESDFLMAGLLASLYLALGVLIVAVEIRRVRMGRALDALSFFNGAYFLFFVFVPLNVLLLGEDAVRQKYAFQNWSHGNLWTAGALAGAYVAFILGYFRGIKAGLIVRVGLGGREVKVACWLVGCFFVIGCLAMAYHISLVGGWVEALQVAPGIRTGEFPLEGKMLFVRQFSFFLATAFMVAWAIHVEISQTKRKFRILHWSLLLLLGISFIYYALSTFGRRDFLYPIAICLVVWALSGQRRQLTGLVFLLVSYVIWFVPYSILIPTAQITAQATAQATSVFLWDAYVRTIQGLADSFMHFVAAQHATLWQFGFLSDIRELPLQFVPSQALGFERSRGMFAKTSEFILGHPLGSGFSGEEPLGLHGYLLVNFSYPGMFLIFYLMGGGYRFLDAILRPGKNGSALSWLIFLWVIIGALEYLREGALILVLKPRFSWWLAMGILLWSYWRSAQGRKSFCDVSSKSDNP